jgi:2-octaprenyl-6-methoxyphenol hydroxylase
MRAPKSSPGVPTDYDIAIVGGGMVGASLALALKDLPLRIGLIEAQRPDDPGQPSFDERTTALSNGTRRIFEGLGIWSEIEPEAIPIRQIHVSERGRFGSAVIDAGEQGLKALGFVVANRAIGAALWRRLAAAANLSVRAPARVVDAVTHPDHLVLTLEETGEHRSVTARLVVAADGAGSLVRAASGVGVSRWDYQQTAVIVQVTPERLNAGTAYERFTETGPIAVLPAPEGRVVVVWTLAPAAAERVMALSDEAFLSELQVAFGWRLGRLVALGKRLVYPLALTQADEARALRVAIIGNAAQGLHPIAGQGFNLGLRDAATLAEVLADALAVAPAEGGSDCPTDLGSDAVLERFASWRQTDRRRLIAFTDGLVRVFASPFGPVRALRSLGLVLFDLSPMAKSALSRLSLGFATRLPRLARGLPLQPPAPVESANRSV